MKALYCILVLALTVACTDEMLALQREPVSDLQVIIRDLQGSDRERRLAAFSDYIGMRIPKDELSPALKAALIKAMEINHEHDVAILRGESPPLEWDGSHDAELGMMREVVRMQDPIAIPVLTRTLALGVTVPRALTDFGHQALPAVLHVAENPESDYTILGTLTTLRFMVQQWGLDSFTSAERARLLRIATRYIDATPEELSGPGFNPSIESQFRFDHTMRLAHVLDAELFGRVVAITRNDELLRQLGIVAEDSRRDVRATLRRILAGEPIRPTYEKYTGRKMR